MAMFNPPHPGTFIVETYLEPHGISTRKFARHLDVSPSTAGRLLSSESHVTPAMALRLSAVLGRTPESWLAMQDNYNLWKARQDIDISAIEPLELAVA